jgi:hypothetical protein
MPFAPSSMLLPVLSLKGRLSAYLFTISASLPVALDFAMRDVQVLCEPRITSLGGPENDNFVRCCRICLPSI